MPKRMNGAV